MHHGRYYDLPLRPERGTGLGKALKIIAHPVRPRIPIWIASLGERNVAMTAEVADGWIPILFIPERAKDVWGTPLAAGAAKRDAALGPLQVTAGGILAIGEGEDVTALRELARPMVALYVGGMGAKGKNFYNELACRYGFEKEAAEIQDLYLSGKKKEADGAGPRRAARADHLVRPGGLRQGARRGVQGGGGDPPAGDRDPARRPARRRPHRAAEGHRRVAGLEP